MRARARKKHTIFANLQGVENAARDGAGLTGKTFNSSRDPFCRIVNKFQFVKLNFINYLICQYLFSKNNEARLAKLLEIDCFGPKIKG